jgi:hypothetical protein
MLRAIHRTWLAGAACHWGPYSLTVFGIVVFFSFYSLGVSNTGMLLYMHTYIHVDASRRIIIIIIINFQTAFLLNIVNDVIV